MTKVVNTLRDITQQKQSGKLIVRDAVDSSITWEAYFGNGNLHFATSTLGQRERLMYLANRHHPDFKMSEFIIDRSDYQFICNRWQSGQFSLQQARQLALTSTQEAFIHLLAIDNAQIEFDPDAYLDVLLLSTSVREISTPITKLIWQWQQIRPQINSPFVRVYLSNADSLDRLLWPQLQSTKAIESYHVALTQNLCLYSIATQLNTDVLELSYLLRSLIHNRDAQISGYGQPQSERHLVGYINDDLTMQDRVKLLLESQGYEVMSLQNPSQAMNHLSRAHPILILLDISTPNIDGYEFCQLLHKSPNLKNVPILMIGSHDSLLGRIKAKMFGANDYINRSLIPENLVDLVNKHVSQSLINT
jgi:twitching motility two-component system response regulator PilG